MFNPETIIYSLISVVIVSLISFVGVFFLAINLKKIKKSLIFLVSFAAGALFGDVFFNIFPEIVREYGFGLKISTYVLLGIIIFFIIEKVIHWRHAHIGNSAKKCSHLLGLINLSGDAFHNLIDGLLIGASYLVNIPIGIATTVAVILHEIPQEIGDFGILIHSGFSKGKALLFNFLTATLAIFGAIISILVGAYVVGITTFLVPFSAGGFIYIAGSNLIPELQKEVKIRRSFLQLFTFLLGIVIMYILMRFN